MAKLNGVSERKALIEKLIDVIGKDKTIKRLEKAINLI